MDDVDVSVLLDDLDFVETCQIKRTCVTRNRDGSISESAGTQSIEVQCAVQPIGGKALQNLLEGDRSLPAIKIWPKVQVQPTMGEILSIGEKITWHERVYTVVEFKDWSKHGFWRAVAVERK